MHSSTPVAVKVLPSANFVSGVLLQRGILLIALAWFALSSVVRAVNPAPDGGYPNSNTAEGEDALLNLTTGGGNTAIGYRALYTNSTGGANTANGFRALYSNTTGGYN